MKIGVLFCGFDCEDFIDQVLSSWIESRQKFTQHQFVFSFVHSQFVEYARFFGARNRVTPHWYQLYKRELNYFFTTLPGTEAEVRNHALSPLKNEQCDIVWLVDADEVYSFTQIQNILNFIEQNQDVAWFQLSFKNYIGDKKHFLQEPFCPPRIFRAKTNHLSLDEFLYDNEVSYRVANTGDFVHQKELSHMVISEDIAWIKHYTWLNNEKSKNKILYQMHRWGNCSYMWDVRHGLTLNEEWHKKYNVPIPKLLVEGG